MDSRAYIDAIRKNDTVSLKRLCEKECPKDENVGNYASTHSLKMLKILHENGYRLHSSLFYRSMKMLMENVIRYLLENNCPQDKNMYITSMISLDTMKLLHQHGFLATIDSIDEAIYLKDINKVKFLHGIGCRLPNLEYAIESNSVEIVKYFVDNNAPYNEDRIHLHPDTNGPVNAYLHKEKILINLSLCKSGLCVHCKIEELENLWQMEDETYSNVIQWLPQEVLDDIILLIK